MTTNHNEYLDTPIEALPMADKPVPNRQPRINTTYKIAIIGEAPGPNEVAGGEPFVGASGRFLSSYMAKAGIIRDAVLLGNVCQYAPYKGDISLFHPDGPQFSHGLAELDKDLTRFNPHICLLLGKTALQVASGEANIGNWRGSLFIGSRWPFEGRKCLAAYHPAACLRQYEWSPLLLLDLMKTRQEADSPTLILPSRDLQTDWHTETVLARLAEIKRNKPVIAIDIEGYVNAMSCISVAPSRGRAFIVPIAGRNGANLWPSDEEEFLIWRALSDTLSDPTIPKVLQNSLYDRFVLQYSYGIVVRGVIDDTMLKHWEKYCELEKGLGFLCSIYTKEPFYKLQRKSEDRDEFYRYCCRDSAVTYEINEVLHPRLDAGQLAHYQFNIELLNPLLYMELRGIRYNTELAAKRLIEVNHAYYSLQYELDKLSGHGFNAETTQTRGEILAAIQKELCYKKDPSRPKKGNDEVYAKAYSILTGTTPLTPADYGLLNSITDLGLNIKSPRFKTYLYSTLGLPVQWSDARPGEAPRPTTDYAAILTLTKHSNHPSLQLALDIGELRTRSQMLEISADPDERVRCGYNLVGSETGRVTCYTSPTGSGYNLQTVPSTDTRKPVGHPLRIGMRDLFQADDGYWFFQCDLSGADGWTVAAHLASLGDPTMLLDYRAGIKPAKVLCYLLRHGAASLTGKSRLDIKDLTKEVDSKDWDYFACKIGQHGSCYLMGARKLAKQIFVQSEGKVVLSERETADLQKLFFVRYRVKLWHDRVARDLGRRPEMTSASGHRRRFFARPTDMLGQALAHEPQNNTTYATNLAAYKLWNDNDNRRRIDGRVTLRIEPLHQVHDALCGQFRKDETAWAVDRIRGYFNNPIIIAGQTLVIPFEGQYGPSWGEQGAKYGGGEI